MKSCTHGRSIFWAASALVFFTYCVRDLEAVTTLGAIGFHEGSRHSVKCVKGFVKGFDIYFKESAAYSGKVITGVRVICSSGKIDVQYEGVVEDKRVFGQTTTDVKSGSCEGAGGVEGLHYRLPKPMADGEIRAGGISILCHKEGSEAGVAARLDFSEDAQDKKILCVDVLKANGDKESEGTYTIDQIDVWNSGKGFAGFDITGCAKY